MNHSFIRLQFSYLADERVKYNPQTFRQKLITTPRENSRITQRAGGLGVLSFPSRFLEKTFRSRSQSCKQRVPFVGRE